MHRIHIACHNHRAKQSAEVQIDWANQRGREDLDEAGWAAARAATKNTNLDEYAVERAKVQHAKTPDGRCEKALKFWLERRSTWSGSFSNKSQLPWLWYVKKLLPRYYSAVKTWRKPRRYINAVSHISNFRFVRTASPTRVHRVSARLWTRSGKLSKGRAVAKDHRYGIMCYCTQAATDIKTILSRLIAFHNPEIDGPGRTPNVMWATSIVLRSSMVNYQLRSIRERDTPTGKSNVFTRAVEVFGSSGPATCHPFARQYGILKAVFSHHEPHPTSDRALGLKQSKFKLTHPSDPTITTTATLIDSRTLPANVREGDVLRMEVISSSPHHAMLSVPQYIGYTKNKTCDRPTIILSIETLGFVHDHTEKFIPRPHDVEFILHLSRHYSVVTVVKSRGETNKTGLFGAYPLLFAFEEGNFQQYLLDHQLDDTNSFILDVIDNHDYENVSVEILCISRYSKRNIKDIELKTSSHTCVFIKSIRDKSNIDISINRIIHVNEIEYIYSLSKIFE